MRRRSAAALLLPVLALASWSCGGDDDAPDASATPAATPAPTSAPASPTAEAAAIEIDEPAPDATVTVPFTMSGGANVFEAALTIDVLGNAAGAVLCTRHVQATSGTGTPGTWEGIMAFTPPDTPVPVTLRAYNFSARDGAMENVVERSVTLSDERPNIVIESPACAEDVGQGMLSVSGMALVFEAVLFVDIRDASGTAVLTQRVMAAGGTEFSPWTATFDLSALPGGFYDVVAYNLSSRDGAIENEFPVQIAVGP